jgi:Uma2 family endonuclease
MAITERRLTLAEFLELPEEEPALEYFGGTVTQKVSPKIRHGALQGASASMVNDFAVPRKLGRAFPETRTTYGGTSTVPDVVVFRWDRIPEDEHGELPEEVFTHPDIAIEVISPGQTVRSLSERCRWYVDNGVGVSLLVEPRGRFIRVFRRGQEAVDVRGGDLIDLGDVIPGLSFRPDELFASLKAR